MKNAAECARRLKRLFSTLRRAGLKTTVAPCDDPLEQVVRGLLSQRASESKAIAAWDRLQVAAVDLNDMRVTPLAELVGTIGAGYPGARPAAEALSRLLNSLFNKQHSLDLSFLNSASRKNAEAFLNGLDGVDPHARALVIMNRLGDHAIPLDDLMLEYLRKGAYVAADAGHDDVQAFLERQVKAKDGPAFYASFKRYAATHSARPPAPAKSAAKAKKKAGDKAARKKPVGAAKKAPKKK